MEHDQLYYTVMSNNNNDNDNDNNNDTDNDDNSNTTNDDNNNNNNNNNEHKAPSNMGMGGQMCGAPAMMQQGYSGMAAQGISLSLYIYIYTHACTYRCCFDMFDSCVASSV